MDSLDSASFFGLARHGGFLPKKEKIMGNGYSDLAGFYL
jgi:hypothetical protein